MSFVDNHGTNIYWDEQGEGEALLEQFPLDRPGQVQALADRPRG